MRREQQIIEKMLELANEFNNLPCNNMRCKDGKCWPKTNLCNAVTEFVLQADKRLEMDK